MNQVERPKTKAERPKPDNVAAIILAAGRSSRMGAFKPLLPFGNKTIIENCIDNLRCGGIEIIVVVIADDPRAAQLRAHLKDSKVIVAVNSAPESEMSASIACGVLTLPTKTKAVVIMPADHAAVPGEVVSALIDEWAKGARLVKPTAAGRGGHPVLVDLSFREELLRLDPKRGLKSLFTEHEAEVLRLDVNSNYIARDMDTWDDYRALHQEVFGVAPPELPKLEKE
ncbi:MAG TPA: nucleotidyltransferase family protein [Pyrinomonadaceae bacterium]|jgi:CTP:molybdopterin cytidylyltransferase MocA